MTTEWLAERFEEQRAHLGAVAYRMLGSTSEAEDAIQEAWLRLARADVSDVANLRGWLTTVISRVCLDMLRTRTSRREAPLDAYVPDPVIAPLASDPEAEVMVADGIGLALLVVLETLKPAERLAFVLHDVFGMSFDEIAPIVERTPAAARQLASRARRRIQGEAPKADGDIVTQRRVVAAFLAAAQAGDFEGLMAVLDPDIVLRADGGAAGAASRIVRGAAAVAAQASGFSKLGLSSELVLVNGGVGIVSSRADAGVFSVLGFTIAAGRIVQIDILADPDRLERLDVSAVRGVNEQES
jgi:RNA polymerase sigma factor (sigma-70 family)